VIPFPLVLTAISLTGQVFSCHPQHRFSTLAPLSVPSSQRKAASHIMSTFAKANGFTGDVTYKAIA
jgi:hypothetical protein